MTQVIRFPPSLAADGSMATVDQDDVEADAELIAAMVLTRPGERPLWPTFGITEPTFAALSKAELAAGVNEYGPDVTITDVRVTDETATAQNVEIEFR